MPVTPNLRRTDLFKETDPNEALPSDEYARRVLRLERYDLRDELALNNDLAFARQVSESYFINCWQLFEEETLDMWKTYGNGVAILSRFELLKSQLAPMLDNILVVENNIKQRAMDLKAPAIVVNKAQFPEPVHEEADARAGCADHFCRLYAFASRCHRYRISLTIHRPRLSGTGLPDRPSLLREVHNGGVGAGSGDRSSMDPRSSSNSRR